jgi:hypothetical protein
MPERNEAVTVDQILAGRASASPASRSVIRVWPDTGYTRRPAVYPVLERQVRSDGTEWVKILVQQRPRNAEAWIPARNTTVRWIDWRIVIDISSRSASIYRQGSLAKRVHVVVGTPSTPTPTGKFYIVDRMRLYNNWAHGVWALATSAYSLKLKNFDGGDGVVALHGRGALWEPVGTAASHGCVRFNDGDMRWIAARVPNGTRLDIQG